MYFNSINYIFRHTYIHRYIHTIPCIVHQLKTFDFEGFGFVFRHVPLKITRFDSTIYEVSIIDHIPIIRCSYLLKPISTSIFLLVTSAKEWFVMKLRCCCYPRDRNTRLKIPSYTVLTTNLTQAEMDFSYLTSYSYRFDRLSADFYVGLKSSVLTSNQYSTRYAFTYRSIRMTYCLLHEQRSTFNF